MKLQLHNCTKILEQNFSVSPTSISYGDTEADITWEIFVKECKLIPQDQAGSSVVSIAANALSIFEATKKIFNLLK